MAGVLVKIEHNQKSVRFNKPMNTRRKARIVRASFVLIKEKIARYLQREGFYGH